MVYLNYYETIKTIKHYIFFFIRNRLSEFGHVYYIGTANYILKLVKLNRNKLKSLLYIKYIKLYYIEHQYYIYEENSILCTMYINIIKFQDKI